MFGRFGVSIKMNPPQGIGLFLAMWIGSISAFGGLSESGSFALDTRSPSPQPGSAFTVDTGVVSSQSSKPFLCSTRHLDQQVSTIFICDLRPTIRPSSLFIVDTMSVPVDTDGDGLPNVWEMRHFGGTTAAVSSDDVDWDGANNYAEYIAGTDPQDAQSLFVMQIINGLDIEWQTIQNRSYTLQSSPDLMVPFADEPDQTDILGTGNRMSVPCQSSDSSSMFYQVVIRLY